jgi:hypothetical protein
MEPSRSRLLDGSAHGRGRVGRPRRFREDLPLVGYDARMPTDIASALDEVRALVDRYRVTCLWYLRDDWVPRTPAEAARALEAIQKHGDLEAFRTAGRLRDWFSRSTGESSAGS